LLAALGVVACSTYDASLLSVSLDPAQAGGSAASSGAGAGASGGDTAGSSGSNSDAGLAAVNAGTAGAEPIAGTGGNSGSAGGGSPGGGSAGASGGGGAALGGMSGGAGAAGSAGTSGSAGALAGAGGAPQYEVIDDFEDQDLILSYLSSLPAAQRRNGTWYPIKDTTSTGMIAPLMIAPLVADTREGFALHLTASGFKDWGAGLGADFKKAGTVTNPYDVSAYKGIRFYAKVAAGSQTALNVLVPTTSTDAHGNKCSDTTTTPNMHCGDHFLCQINSIKTSWAAYECDFVDLHQQLIPGDFVATFDPTAVYSMQLSLVTKTYAADLWLDDVSFVLK
jgi:hypothetical protein